MPRLLCWLPVLVVAASAGCIDASGRIRPSRDAAPSADAIRPTRKPDADREPRDTPPEPSGPAGRAGRIDVTPDRASAKPGAKQVLVATVYGPDGQPRRRQRVEWELTGPGRIVEVDDPGLLAGRVPKATSTTAVGYTGSFGHTVERAGREVGVQPGQTWCVVTSAEPGKTTVTVRAPDAADGDKGTATVHLTWADGQFTFPPAASATAGGSAELVTTLNAAADGSDRLKVRYRVLDGAPAELPGGRTETEVTPTADGAAAVKVTQPEPKAGRTRVAVEVVKPDPSGDGPGTVVGSKETTVEWGSAELTLDASGPKTVAVDREAAVTLVVANAGKGESAPVRLHATIPDGAEFVSADPPPAVRQGQDLTWSVGAVPAGGKFAHTLRVRPTRKGQLAVAAWAETPDGQRADHKATLMADAAGLKVAATAASAGMDKATVRVAVTNTGAVPAENVTAWVGYDPGLDGPGGRNPAELPVGTIPPGETKRVEVALTPRQGGTFPVRVSVTADGGLADRAETAVEARKPGLFVGIVGPDKLTVGQEATFDVTVTNPGDVELTKAEVRADLPPGLTAKSPADWKTGRLPPKGKETLRLVVSATRATARKNLSVTATGTPASGPAVTAAADAPVEVVGQPALVLEVADVPGTVPVGGRATVRVTVRNRGTAAAKRVEVALSATDELTVAGGTGADRAPARVDGQRATFGLIGELPPGSAAVFVLDLDGAKPGSARVQAEVRADHLAQPLREEQSTRVAGK